MMVAVLLPRIECLHQRQHHAEVDPVGDAVGEERSAVTSTVTPRSRVKSITSFSTTGMP